MSAFTGSIPYTPDCLKGYSNNVMNHKILNIKALWVVVLLLAGCSSQNVALLPEVPSSTASSYLVGPGDQLKIFVWRNPELSADVVVRPDGKISSPLITELEVSGLEAPLIAGLIENELAEYIRTPRVTVIVSNFNGAVNQQIRIIGNATNPKVIPYRSGMTLLDVMIAAEGLSEFADGDNAKLIRKENGVDVPYRIMLESLIKDGDISMNRTVLPGDTIIIPESSF